MPLLESESLVLRSYDLSEADRITVFLTREHGIVRGVAKGAKRLKSRFGSTLEPFSLVNLTYFHKEDRELVSVQNVDLLGSRFEAASDPEFLSTFSYLAELLIALLPPHDRNERTYRMARACLDLRPSRAEEFAALRLYFELWLLRLGGYLPDWSRCGGCSREITGGTSAWLERDVDLICSACLGSRRLVPVSPLYREVVGNIQKKAPGAFISEPGLDPQAVSDLSELFRSLVGRVVGRELSVERLMAANYWK